jgi:release factor glutamine methyltransferase
MQHQITTPSPPITNTLTSLLSDSTNKLTEISISPEQDALLLLESLLPDARKLRYQKPHMMISPAIYSAYKSLLTQRISGKPCAYILGHSFFWDLQLLVSSNTLIPRKETEILVEYALNNLNQNLPLHILDLGTGCGAIALSLAKASPLWNIVGSDICPAALMIAQENRYLEEAYQVTWLNSNWLEHIPDHHSFDAIIWNPPYIAEDDPNLEKLTHEPALALNGGKDGMQVYLSVYQDLTLFLRPQGMLLIEHGYNQQQELIDLFAKTGEYESIEGFKDYNQQARFICCRKK